MTELEIKSASFHQAELCSEKARVTALLGVLGGLLTLVLIRGVASLSQGYRGEAWPFAVLLVAMTGYEVLWIRFIGHTISSGEALSNTTWKTGTFVESLLPTAALILQVHSTFAGPQRGLTSPVVLGYFPFIILSTLHLDPGLSRLCGGFSAAGYAVVCIYTYLLFPEVVAGWGLLEYGTCFAVTGFLLLGGFAAGAVARQIRLHVLAAIREIEVHAQISQQKHDLEIARSIQRGLLPRTPPKIEGFDIAGWNQPADETGGDYYDWQELPDGRVAFTIADVTGHGIGSALCMAACRAHARASLASGADLRCVLLSLNQLLYEDLPSEKFVTLAMGLLDPDDGTLELISAGHGPLLFYLSAENRFRSYDAQGLPLGLMEQATYGSPQMLKFSTGDILLLVTDGFIEWTNAKDEDFGEHRLKEVIRTHRDLSAAAIISELHAAALNFSDSVPQADDLTVVIIKGL